MFKKFVEFVVIAIVILIFLFVFDKIVEGEEHNLFEFKVGDIILAHGGRLDNVLLRIRLQTFWNHCALVYDTDRSIELDSKHVNHKLLKIYKKKKIKVIRFTKLTDEDRQKLVEVANNNRHIKLDQVGLYNPLQPRPKKDQHWCNTYLEFLYKEALGWDISILDISRGKFKPYERYDLKIIYDYGDKK